MLGVSIELKSDIVAISATVDPRWHDINVFGQGGGSGIKRWPWSIKAASWTRRTLPGTGEFGATNGRLAVVSKYPRSLEVFYAQTNTVIIDA